MERVEDLFGSWVAIHHHDRFPVVEDLAEVIGDEFGDEGDFLEDVVPVGAGEFGDVDVGVIDLHLEPFAEEAFDDIDDGAFAEIVGAGLEGEAEEGDVVVPVVEDALEDEVLLDLVAAGDAVEDGGFEVVVVGDGAEGLEILGQAGSPVGEAGLEVGLGDVEPLVLAEDIHQLVGIDAELLADVPDLVSEGDLEGMEAVADILHELRDAALGDNERGIEVLVDVAHDLYRPVTLGADEGEGRVVEVRDRAAFPEELWIGDHREVHPAGQS